MPHIKLALSAVGIVFLFVLYIGLLLLTAAGYCVKLAVDGVLSEIVTGFWRLGNKLGMGIEER